MSKVIMKRISLRVFLALFTFLIGMSLTAFWVFLYSPESQLDSQQSAVFDRTIEQTVTSQLNEDKQNNGEIEIKYAWSLLGIDSLDGYFVVKNNSGETIHYLRYVDFVNPVVNPENHHSWIKQNGRIKALKINSKDLTDGLVKEQDIKPNESVTFSLPVPQNEKSFEAGFGFRIGNEQKEKIVWTKVKKQLKSFGIGCNEEITKLGDALLEATCIKVEPN